MKLILFFFLFIYTFFAFSQIDVKKVETLCFEYHNVERVKNSLPERIYSKTCENSANLQTTYLLKNYVKGQSLHDQTIYTNGKIYKSEEDRYNLYNKDSVTYQNSKNKTNLFTYQGEIALSGKDIEMVLDSNINETLSKNIISWFMQSKGHRYCMLNESYYERSQRGFFSVKINVKSVTETRIIFDLYCVAVFDYSIAYHIYDYTNKKWVQN